jgi:hypothetical protein
VPPPEVAVEQETAPAASASTAPAEQMAARKSLERNEAEADSSADVQEVAVTGGRTRRATGRTAGPRNTISTRGLTSESRPASDDQAERSDPETWLEEIRDLRRAGKTDEADREWQRFREAFPEFHVADDDIARKRP